MLRVASLGSLICDRIASTTLHEELVVKTLLLHDMGNILKFDFSRIDLFEEADRENLKAYKIAQQKFRKQYGLNPDEATLKIINEVTHNQSIVNLCRDSHWENLGQVLKTDNWEAKIACYADMRVGPFGLLTLAERIQDLKKRRPEESSTLDRLLRQGLAVEKELDNITELKLNELSDNEVKQRMMELNMLEI